MNLHNYFTQQAQQRLSDERKILLYQRISEQKSQVPHTFKRAKILTKNRVYTFLATILVFAFFGTFFRENPSIKEYRAFFTEKKIDGLNTANAAQVAKILEFNGEYVIEKGGKKFQNSALFDGDVIILKDKAKVVFNINDHIKAEVLWPSKFTITKVQWDKYRIYLMEGDSLKIEWEKDTDALQVETTDMMIESSKDEKINLEITRSDQKTQIKNAGAKILVKSKKAKETDLPTTLETAKLLTMQEDDIAKISDIETLSDVLSTRKNLTHTKILPQSWSGEERFNVMEEGLVLLSSEDKSFLDDVNTQEKVSSGLVSLISSELAYENDDKKIPTENQLSQITAALNASFLLDDIELIYQAKLLWDDQKLESAYKNIAWRIKSVGDTYAIELAKEIPQESLLAELSKLEKGLDVYHLPPAKIQQLSILRNWIKHFQHFTPTQEREVYKKELPKELRFK